MKIPADDTLPRVVATVRERWHAGDGAATLVLLARVPVPGMALASLNVTLREHPKGRHRRQAKLLARLAPFWNRYAGTAPAGFVHVTIVRVSARPYDGDNFPSGDAKAVRDWIARTWLKRDDADGAALVWAYEQRRGDVGVVIEIRGAAPAGGE